MLGNVALAEEFCRRVINVSAGGGMETDRVAERLDVTIFHCVLPAESDGEIFIDFHILPEDARRLSNSMLYHLSDLILLVADVSAPQADEYLRSAVKFPTRFAAANCPIAVLGFGSQDFGSINSSGGPIIESLHEAYDVQYIPAFVDSDEGVRDTLKDILTVMTEDYD
eukprot:CAMPEP_0119120904 /NCGR_PEP_ID=MMETSP1310-20130426/1757_1 /TAXON_ID=464262 /ORGANISM="Genus nov. species nov., Strain RCC2339" /LENGTH=167 /DNA_ID=CAMNT_0007110421 /DNA_START=383 /DNA_END=886 /DNA_ORIENTATION=-